MSEQKNSLGMDKKTASWFSYVFSIVSAIIILATEKDDRTVRAHAWQSLAMGCIFILGYIVLAILFAIIGWRAWGLFAALNWIWGVGWLALTLICVMQALQDKIFEVPVIYNISEKFNK